MENTTSYEFLSDALIAFEELAIAPEFRDYEMVVDDVALRNAPAPFTVACYSYNETYEKECPDYEHSCIREGCGVSWSTGGDSGVTLTDSQGRVWNDVGIRERPSRGV